MNGDSGKTTPQHAQQPAIPGLEPSVDAVRAATAARDNVQQRIRVACTAHDRPPGAVQLLAVSKTFDASHVAAMAATGQRAFGENYLQEALAKQALLADQEFEAPLEWHFIGPIQSNKSRPIAEHFDWAHTVDRERIARRLSEQRPAALPPLQICLQVNIDDEGSKSGCTPAQAAELALSIAPLPGISLRGLMAIPAVSGDPLAQRAAFARVRGVFEQCQEALAAAPGSAMFAARFDTLSMGMTGDLEAAIAEGATIVRVGTALFGQRAPRDSN